jgi:hypothetical protein
MSEEVDKKVIIDEFLKSKDFIDKINAEKSKAVDAFKTEKLDAIIESEFEKRMKLQEEKNKKSPEQIQLEEALKRIEKMEMETAAERREKLRLENKASALSELSNKGLKVPDSILDKFISEEKDKTQEQLKLFEDFISDYTSQIKTEKIKSNNITPPGDNSAGGNTIPEPGPDATKEEWKAYDKAIRAQNN